MCTAADRGRSGELENGRNERTTSQKLMINKHSYARQHTHTDMRATTKTDKNRREMGLKPAAEAERTMAEGHEAHLLLSGVCYQRMAMANDSMIISVRCSRDCILGAHDPIRLLAKTSLAMPPTHQAWTEPIQVGPVPCDRTIQYPKNIIYITFCNNFRFICNMTSLSIFFSSFFSSVHGLVLVGCGALDHHFFFAFGMTI